MIIVIVALKPKWWFLKIYEHLTVNNSEHKNKKLLIIMLVIVAERCLK